MRTNRLSAEDHASVTAAVAAAERGTDGEIVTIVAQASDSYRDIAWIWSVIAMLVALGLLVFIPGVVEAKLNWLTGGWGEAGTRDLLLLAIAVEAIVLGVVRLALEWVPLRMRMTPRRVRSRRVRKRAVSLFRVGAEKRTANRVGILLYLSLDEHQAEIIADAAIHGVVPAERWGDAMAALIDRVRVRDTAGGMIAAVGAMGAILAEKFPKSDDDVNELPDRLIEL